MEGEISKWFISPDGQNQEYISDFFSKIIHQLIEDRSNASNNELVPRPEKDLSFINDLNNSHSLEQVLDKLSHVYKGSMNASSTGYIGQMDSIPNIGAIAGDLVTASINNNMLANEMSPLLSWLEQRIVTLFTQWFGFDEHSGGVMTSGGTLANIQALTVARNSKLGISDGNVFELRQQPVFFASEHSHSSIAKAGMLLGIGLDNVIKVKADATGKMSIDDLLAKIEASIASNKLPFAVVSTYGTTNSGSIDDVDKIQSICEKFNLWHHIDAIYGGAMVLSQNQKYLCPAFEKADSLSFNPQKWMFVSKTCSVLLFRNFEQLENNFRISAPYVSENDKINLGEYGIQGSRHASILKLWLSLYLIGTDAYAKMIDLNMSITQSFTAYIMDNEHLELYTKPDLNIILFRPIRLTGQNEQDHSDSISSLQSHLYQHNIYISEIPWEGEPWLKCIFLNPYFDKAELEVFISRIDDFFSH